MKAFSYLGLQWKRASRFLPFVFIVSLLLLLGIGLLLNTLLWSDHDKEENQKLTVGITGNTEDEYVKMGIAAVSDFDASRFSIDFLELDLETAQAMLDRGEITAYAIIPDGFVEGVMYGTILPITYVTGHASIGIGTMLKEEVTAMISCIVIESQKGAYGLQALMKANKLSGISKQMDAINLRYFSAILGRTAFVEAETIGISDGLSFSEYMTCGFLILLLLLLGVSCCPLFSRKDQSLHRLLAASGQSNAIQVLCELAAYVAMLFITLLTLFLAAELGFRLLPSGQFSLSEMLRMDLFSLAVRLFPALLAIAAMQFFLYELCDNIVSALLLQVLCALSLGYVSGCFYPIGFLPKSIQYLSSATPSGAARQYLETLLSDARIGKEVVLLMGFTVVFFALSVLVRSRRVKVQ